MADPKVDDQFTAIVRASVEGQLRSFLHDHPEALESTTWYKNGGGSRAKTFVGSLSKRIVSDLTCAQTRARLASALGPSAEG